MKRHLNKSKKYIEGWGRGPNIPDDWKRYITAQSITEPLKPRMLLADEILGQMNQSRDIRPDKLPERESIAKLISRARNQPESQLDKPWSVGASVKYGLLPEATKDLFDIWRISLAIDRPLTIRQAKWIMYLRTLYQGQTMFLKDYSDRVTRDLELISQSWLYSILERAYEIMGEKDFNTNSLDSALSMPYTHWEYETAVKLGKVSRIKFPQKTLVKMKNSGFSLVGPPRSTQSVEQAVWHSVRHEPPPHLEMHSLGFHEEVLPEEADLVAAYWLTYLSKGPLWNRLPEQPEIQKIKKERKQKHTRFDSHHFIDDSLYSRQSSIRRRLLKWVKQNSNKTNPEYTGLFAILQPATPTKMDPDLLKAVGYEINAEKDTNRVKEASNER